MGKDTLRTSGRTFRSHGYNPLYGSLMNSSQHVAVQYKFIDRSMEEGIDDIDEKISSKILNIARKQKERLEKANEDEEERNVKQKFPLGFDPDEDIDQMNHQVDLQELGIDPSDEILFQRFLLNKPRVQKEEEPTDITMDDDQSNMPLTNNQQVTEDEYQLSPRINPKVIEVYKKIGEKLKCYASGKLPKAIKIIPSLSNWEEVLHLTEPNLWSTRAVYKITCMFIISLNANQTQRFFSTVILSRIRADITANKALNHHLYLTLKETLEKPISFVKGILLPLCESGTCTLVEAVNIGSVLEKSSFPNLYSSTALSCLAGMEYTGSNSLFIRELLEKKHALSFKTVSSLVIHFSRFKHEPREMPILWYQSMLVFVQRYKQDLISEQKDELLKVMKYKYHDIISPKIRQELVSIDMQGDIDIAMVE